MSFFTAEKPTRADTKQSRLLALAALFLLLYSVTLTLAPAARLHSWQVAYRWNHWIGYLVWLAGIILVNRQIIQRLPDRDPYLFPIGALLSGWGVLTIWRLDPVMGARQTAWLAICMAVFFFGLRVRDLLAFLRRYKYLWLTGGLLLTALTFLFGTYPGGVGPRLWLGCCGIYLQPSEPLKLLLIAYLAAYLADRLPISFNLLPLLTPTLLLIGAALALLIGQRDLGTASLFILIYTFVIYIASQRRRILVLSILVLIAAGATGYLLFDVVRLRIDAWINPWIDPAGRSYQIIQSLIAVASGGILGHGPGLGSPGVVPIAHSDFIFSSIAEETGLIGVIALLSLFGLLVGRGLRAALLTSNNYRRYLAAGLTAYLAMQAIIIMGGNLRLLPLTGVTLPFVSYGGSSLLTAFFSLFILTLISSHGEEESAVLHNPIPYAFVGGGLLAGLLLLAAGTGWWATVRNVMLTARPENPRRVITDRYVRRGALLDRNNAPISSTSGTPGSYQRQYDYPALSNTAGYNNPLYGQSGLESGLDNYLRGLRGNPTSLVWTDDLLYGQPPPGVDVRLTIDLVPQKKADELLANRKAALVLLNARTGEILAISSHPNFDPAQLEVTWPTLAQDPSAPLLNRATQGRYPPGAALGPFLLSYTSRSGNLPALSDTENYTANGKTWNCAVEPAIGASPQTGSLVADGCPAPLAVLGSRIGVDDLDKLFASLGFYETPRLPLQLAESSAVKIEHADLAAIGQENLLVTPLQMALAAAALSNNGVAPAPMLALSMRTPDAGWVAIPPGSKHDTILLNGTQTAVNALADPDGTYWQAVALAQSSQETLTWYLAGSLSQSQSDPLALALVLEENNPALAQQIGQTVLVSAKK